MTIFETDRLQVRVLRAADRSFYLRLFGDAEVVQYIRAPQTEETIDYFLNDHLVRNNALFPKGRFVVEDKISHEPIGSFVIIPIESHEAFQLGYALLKDYWGLGLATELVRAGIFYAFQACHLNQIYALTEVPHRASQKVLEKNGFTYSHTQEQNGTPLKWYLRE